jgi:hypothetical protein
MRRLPLAFTTVILIPLSLIALACVAAVVAEHAGR